MQKLFSLFVIIIVVVSCSKTDEIEDNYNDFSKDSGTFVDGRDNHTYNWTKIGGQIWMAENLAYLPTVHPSDSGSLTESRYYVYGYEGINVAAAKQQANYTIYGGLYNWPAAMAGASGSSANPSGVQGICPNGWHLPSDAEWEQLAQYISDQKGPYSKSNDYIYLWYWNEVGKHLKATSGWEENQNGTDDYGFSALPGGSLYDNGSFDYIGFIGFWWSSTEGCPSIAWDRTLSYGFFVIENNPKNFGFSVRCIRD